MEEEVAIKRHPITAGIIGIITVVYSFIVFVLVLLNTDMFSYGVMYGLVAVAPFLLVFGAVGGALFFRSHSLVHQFWLAPALFVLYFAVLSAATTSSFA